MGFETHVFHSSLCKEGGVLSRFMVAVLSFHYILPRVRTFQIWDLCFAVFLYSSSPFPVF